MSIKSTVGYKFPRLLSIWRIVRISRGRFSFSGWGMYTDSFTTPPWNSILDGVEVDSAIGFKQTNESLRLLVSDKKFNLSQFSHLSDQSEALNPLKWRHYFVYWSALSAAKSTQGNLKNLVEMGTCDGLTAFFAMTAMNDLEVKFKFYMYDAWEAMRGDDLFESEKSKVGMYGYLNLNTTIDNLQNFSTSTVFNKGYIPDSFKEANNPNDLIWLHIDLNAAAPTRASLEFFYEKMLSGGIFLFDDYASHDHLETKQVVDDFFHSRNVNLIQLPTGQSMVFKL
jgi:hypothetical protein